MDLEDFEVDECDDAGGLTQIVMDWRKYWIEVAIGGLFWFPWMEQRLAAGIDSKEKTANGEKNYNGGDWWIMAEGSNLSGWLCVGL